MGSDGDGGSGCVGSDGMVAVGVWEVMGWWQWVCVCEAHA